MLLTKTSLLVLVFIVKTCRGKLVADPSPDESTASLVEGMVKIVTSCYKGQINTIGLVGHLPISLARTLSAQSLMSTVLMDNTSHMMHATNLVYKHSRYRYKLEVFVVGASSQQELGSILQLVVETSIWPNHMASFFILDQSHECENSANFLLVAWQLDLLNAKVMCHHHTYGRYIFNYNPFTSHAPATWYPRDVFRVLNHHPFTVFEREYQGNETICLNLDFIKTKDLGGYEISVHGPRPNVTFHQKNFDATYRSELDMKRMWDTVSRFLNATLKFSGASVADSPKNADIVGFYASATTATTYPHRQVGVVLVSKFRGHMTQLEKIFNLIDIDSRIGVGIVYLVTLIFFKTLVHQALVPALLNLIRITCNVGFANLPDNNASRLYLTGLLFFVVTMQGIYQGKLASLLTNKISRPNVDSLEDLVKFDCKVYGNSHYEPYFQETGLKERFTPIDDSYSNILKLLDDSSTVYIGPEESLLIDYARKKDWHLSRAYVGYLYVGFPVRRYCYLEDPLNILLKTLVEADISQSWVTKCNPTNLAEFQHDKEVKKNVDFKIIEFSEVRFAFVILGIGLLCATVTFIVEVAIY